MAVIDTVDDAKLRRYFADHSEWRDKGNYAVELVFKGRHAGSAIRDHAGQWRAYGRGSHGLAEMLGDPTDSKDSAVGRATKHAEALWLDELSDEDREKILVPKKKRQQSQAQKHASE